MKSIASRWLMFGLVIGWSLSHAAVFAQPAKTQPTDKIRQGLDKVISVDFSGQSLSEVINHMREKTGVRINIDQFAIMQTGMNPDENVGQVAVKATNEKASQVLRRLLNPYNLTYTVYEDALLITTEEMAIYRVFRQRVSVDIEDVPFRKAVRDLARAHGVNLVLDPKIASQFETKVSLQLDNTELETTIRLLAEVADLKSVAMGNVLFVTNEERAKKIREEDRVQNENPITQYPRVMPSPFMRGGIGIGGIAMPPMRGIAVPGIANPDFAPAPPLIPPGIEPAPPKEAPRKQPPQLPRVNPDGTSSSPAAPPQIDPPVIRRIPQVQSGPAPAPPLPR